MQRIEPEYLVYRNVYIRNPNAQHSIKPRCRLEFKSMARNFIKAFLIAQPRDRAFRFYDQNVWLRSRSCPKFSRFPRAPFVKSETLPLLGINAGQSSVSHQFPRRGRGQSKQPVPIIVRQSVYVCMRGNRVETNTMADVDLQYWKRWTEAFKRTERPLVDGQSGKEQKPDGPLSERDLEKQASSLLQSTRDMSIPPESTLVRIVWLEIF